MVSNAPASPARARATKARSSSTPSSVAIPISVSVLISSSHNSTSPLSFPLPPAYPLPMAVAHLAPGAPDPALMASALRDFLSTHEGVHVSEAGQPVARLDSASGYALDCASGHLVFHLWSADANFVRRVLRAAPRDSQRMDLDCWRMGHPRPTR